jgi:hypothetical protein
MPSWAATSKIPTDFFNPHYFWHMTCIICLVAKKYHPQVMLQGAFQSVADPVAMNIRMSMFPVPRLGPPPRPKKIRVPRRRLVVSGLEEPAQPVKIVYGSQNLDTRMIKPQMPCESRA